MNNILFLLSFSYVLLVEQFPFFWLKLRNPKPFRLHLLFSGILAILSFCLMYFNNKTNEDLRFYSTGFSPLLFLLMYKGLDKLMLKDYKRHFVLYSRGVELDIDEKFDIEDKIFSFVIVLCSFLIPLFFLLYFNGK